MDEADKQQFIDWVWQMRHLNLFVPEVMSYPRTVVCKASAGDEALAYIPLQSVLMYDSIAPKPGLSPRQEAMSLWRIGEAVDKAAQDSKHREVYFFCKDDRVADICSDHGFEEIRGVRLLRRRLPEVKA